MQHAKYDVDGLSLQQKRKEFEGCLKRINNIHSWSSLMLDLLCITDA